MWQVLSTIKKILRELVQKHYTLTNEVWELCSNLRSKWRIILERSKKENKKEKEVRIEKVARKSDWEKSVDIRNKEDKVGQEIVWIYTLPLCWIISIIFCLIFIKEKIRQENFIVSI